MTTRTHSPNSRRQSLQFVLDGRAYRVQRNLVGSAERQSPIAAIASDESGDKIRCRCGQHVARCRNLLKPPAGTEDGNVITEFDCLVDVVGDKDDRLLQFALKTEHFGLQILTHHRVDGAEGLVHQQDRRIGSQCTRNSHTLLLPTRELPGIAGGKGDVQTDSFEYPQRGFARCAAGLTAQYRNCCDVVDHGAMRKQAGVLDDVPDAETQLHRVGLGDVTTVDEDLARRRV